MGTSCDDGSTKWMGGRLYYCVNGEWVLAEPEYDPAKEYEAPDEAMT
jgi:hypothetical protein